MPITWRNVTAPSTAVGANLLGQSSNLIDSAFKGIGNVIDERIQKDTERNTQEFLSQIQGMTPEQLAAAQQSGELDQLRSKYGEFIDPTKTDFNAIEQFRTGRQDAILSDRTFAQEQLQHANRGLYAEADQIVANPDSYNDPASQQRLTDIAEELRAKEDFIGAKNVEDLRRSDTIRDREDFISQSDFEDTKLGIDNKGTITGINDLVVTGNYDQAIKLATKSNLPNKIETIDGIKRQRTVAADEEARNAYDFALANAAEKRREYQQKEQAYNTAAENFLGFGVDKFNDPAYVNDENRKAVEIFKRKFKEDVGPPPSDTEIRSALALQLQGIRHATPGIQKDYLGQFDVTKEVLTSSQSPQAIQRLQATKERETAEALKSNNEWIKEQINGRESTGDVIEELAPTYQEKFGLSDVDFNTFVNRALNSDLVIGGVSISLPVAKVKEILQLTYNQASKDDDPYQVFLKIAHEQDYGKQIEEAKKFADRQKSLDAAILNPQGLPQAGSFYKASQSNTLNEAIDAAAKKAQETGNNNDGSGRQRGSFLQEVFGRGRSAPAITQPQTTPNTSPSRFTASDRIAKAIEEEERRRTNR